MPSQAERDLFQAKVAEAVSIIEEKFSKYIDENEGCQSRKPLVLRDFDIPEIIHGEGVTYPFRSTEELLATVAVLNAAVFDVETSLRKQGYIPKIAQGVICSFHYSTTYGYWYRDDISWWSLHPLITIDFED